MAKLTKSSVITILNEKYEAKDLINTLIFYPASSVKEFFQSRGLSVPRQLRIKSLKVVVQDLVPETRKERLTLADELNYRLSWFEQYTETQLENLLVFYKDINLDRAYLEELWLNLIDYMNSRGISQESIDELRVKSVEYARQNGLILPDVKKYNKELNELFFDIKGQIDGLTVEKIRPVLYKSSTLTEIRELGTKYGVDVPRRLKKNELADIILSELRDRGEVSKDEEERIKGMNVIVMQRFAINNNIKASTELKKEEIIEYILKNAQETRETYFVPEASVYDVEVEQVAAPVEEPVVEEVVEPVVEEVIEEPVVEEVIEPVKETIIERVIEPQQVVVHQRDDSQIAEELRLLRETVAGLQFEIDNDVLVNEPVAEPIYHEGAVFVGDKKTWKKVYKLDKQAEPESKLVSNASLQPVALVASPPKNAKKRNPFVSFLKFLMWLIIWLLIILLIFAVVTYFVPSIQSATQGVIDAIDTLKISGKGIIGHIHSFLESIGL